MPRTFNAGFKFHCEEYRSGVIVQSHLLELTTEGLEQQSRNQKISTTEHTEYTEKEINHETHEKDNC